MTRVKVLPGRAVSTDFRASDSEFFRETVSPIPIRVFPSRFYSLAIGVEPRMTHTRRSLPVICVRGSPRGDQPSLTDARHHEVPGAILMYRYH
jgi:hypothetical protein